MAASPEFRLAAACAMWPSSNRRIEAIHAAAREVLDWRRFLRVALRHRVVGLVHDGLTRAEPGVPAQIAQDIAAHSAQVRQESLAMAAEALRLQRLFAEADLPVLFVKGASLAVLAFGNLGLCSSQDIDLLVPLETLSAASALISRAGYRRFDPPSEVSEGQLRLLLPLRKDLGFIHHATGRQLELHWRLFPNPHAMDETSFTAASRIVSLYGTQGIRTLGEEDLFAYLCMHGALHWWHRLKWLADVNALLAAGPEGHIECLVRAAHARGAGRAAIQALLLCRRVLGTPLPAPLMAAQGHGAMQRWLQATALDAMTRGQGEGDQHEARFGTTRGSLSTFLLNPSWRYWVAELKNQLTSQADVLAMPLPEQLRFLYPVLRLPLWAWRHAAKPGARQ
jgi:hypothetical protein